MIAPRRERGFTLVEMLVALLIFAVLAGAGVTLLRTSVDTQQAVDRSLADLSAAARLRVVLGNDLAQAVVRPIAGAPGGMIGTATATLLVRAAEPAERSQGEAGLQAVRWALDGGRLVRTSMASDGREASPGTVLARDVTSVQIRYRAAAGEWRDGWSAAAGEQPLPSAIDMRIERKDEAAVSLIVALPQGPAPVAEPAA